MKNMIWVRIFIASLALLGDNALASENHSQNLHAASFFSHAFDASNQFSDFDPDSHSVITIYYSKFDIQQVDLFRVTCSISIPEQAKYFLAYPRAPPVVII